MKKLFFSFLIIANLLSIEAFSQNETSLNFRVTGFGSNGGQALLELYRPTDNVPKKPFMTVKANIVNKEAKFAVKNLPFGDYAAIFVHDQNGNNKIDHNWGIPSEPLGYTNNWKLSIVSGMPSFEKLKFNFSKTTNTFVIKMSN